jgi:L-fuculose-phosphate aldolase
MISRSKRETTHFGNQLVAFAKTLHSRGLVSGTDGNLSIRLDSKRIMITPSGRCKGMLKPSDMVIVDFKGHKLSGIRNPSSELGMHLEIYSERAEINAIVHAHPRIATGFASAGIALDEPLCSEVLITFGTIPLAPYATPGTPELSESLHPLICGHNAILMANHGVVSYGESLLEAYLNMEVVEHVASIALVTRLLGRCRLISDEDAASLRQLKTHYAKEKQSDFATSKHVVFT